MVRFAVCDDTKAELDLVADKIFEYYDDNCEIIKYQNGEKLLEDSRTKVFDVIFLDIVMPMLDGMEVAKKIRERNRYVKIVFVTNRAELAYMGYIYEAFRFVRKSNLEQELSEAVKSLKIYFKSSKEHLLLKTPDGEIIRDVKDIKYFEVLGHTLTVVCDSVERVCGTMAAFEKSLIKNGFIRIHKGFLVNLRYIGSIQKNDVVLTSGEVLPISRKRLGETYKKLREFRKTD